MGFFSKLFSSIDTNYSSETKSIYNNGVIALSEGNLPQAIHYFREIEDEHPSAAYNLGLIYLDGAGILLPDYDKARHYFQLAHELGHTKAQKSAEIIGLREPEMYNFTCPDEKRNMAISISIIQFLEGGQCGNLAYVLANFFVLLGAVQISQFDNQAFEKTLSDFIHYEVYCIKNFANEEVMKFYQISSLKNIDIHWDGLLHTSELSDFFNKTAVPLILKSAKSQRKKLELADLGILRLMIVNYVYNHCITYFRKDFFEKTHNKIYI